MTHAIIKFILVSASAWLLMNMSHADTTARIQWLPDNSAAGYDIYFWQQGQSPSTVPYRIPADQLEMMGELGFYVIDLPQAGTYEFMLRCYCANADDTIYWYCKDQTLKQQAFIDVQLGPAIDFTVEQVEVVEPIPTVTAN